jgi:hypothetical protein
MLDNGAIFVMMAVLVVVGLPIAERFDRRHDEHLDSTCGTCGSYRAWLGDKLRAADEV